MLKRITSFFQKTFFGFVSFFSPVQFSFVPENLQEDILPELSGPMQACGEEGPFKCYAKMEEYNYDLMKMFHAHTEVFYLDSSHKDGHFRV